MIDLAQDRHDKLVRLVAAGASGLPIDDVGIGTALSLQQHGLAKVSPPERPQRVTITRQGEAFHLRGAFA